MYRKDLKKYTNWYNGKQRLFIGRSYSFIYLRGCLGYNFWRKWAKFIKPCSLYDYRVLWNLDVNTGLHIPQSKDNNSYGRRLYQRHCSFMFLKCQEKDFGFDTSHSLLWFDRWSLNEHKEHCLGIKFMRNYEPLPKE